jgi:hypothetical protein
MLENTNSENPQIKKINNKKSNSLVHEGNPALFGLV